VISPSLLLRIVTILMEYTCKFSEKSTFTKLKCARIESLSFFWGLNKPWEIIPANAV
jgi:hypothetical protein